MNNIDQQRPFVVGIDGSENTLAAPRAAAPHGERHHACPALAVVRLTDRGRRAIE